MKVMRKVYSGLHIPLGYVFFKFGFNDFDLWKSDKNFIERAVSFYLMDFVKDEMLIFDKIGSGW
jgi:hypothetical protein